MPPLLSAAKGLPFYNSLVYAHAKSYYSQRAHSGYWIRKNFKSTACLAGISPLSMAVDLDFEPTSYVQPPYFIIVGPLLKVFDGLKLRSSHSIKEDLVMNITMEVVETSTISVSKAP